MATTTATKRKPRRKTAAGNGKVPVPGDLLSGQSPAAGGVLRGEGRDLPIEAIGPSPFNPRTEYPAEEIAALAETIKADGLLQPITVRPRPGYKPKKLPATIRTAYFEIVAGHRRWRACKAAGLEKIPCVIRPLSDADVRRVQAIENAQRQDLSPIEEARQFRGMLRNNDAAGPTELARQLGLSQGHVSNRLRLLELPEKWVERIASGVLPATHARELLKYKDHPKVLAEVERRVFRTKGDPHVGSVNEFAEDVAQAVYFLSEPMKGTRWDSKTNVSVPVFTPTPEQEQELEIVEIDDYGGKPVRQALNKKVWAKLQAKHAKEFIANRRKPAKAKRGKSAAKKPDKPLTAAERKAEAAAERARKAKHAAQRRERWGRLKFDRLRHLIAELLLAGVEPETLHRVLLYFCAARLSYGSSVTMGRDLDAVCRGRQVKMPRGSFGLPNIWRGIEAIPNRMDEAASEWLALQFWDPKTGPRRIVSDGDVERIADFLCIDLAKAWKVDQLGPLSPAGWSSFNKEELIGRAGKAKVAVDPSMSKDAIVAALVKAKNVPMPKEILKAKRPR